MEHLRSQAAPAQVPIIIIAGEASPHQDKALQAGAEAFFPKPIDHRQLLVAIHKALGEGQMLQRPSSEGVGLPAGRKGAVLLRFIGRKKREY